MSFINNVLSLIELKNISKNKMCIDLNLAKTSFLNWSERGTIPNGDTLAKIADYFGVSVDYLLDREKENNICPQITPEEAKVLRCYNSLSDAGKEKAVEYLQMLKQFESQGNKQ